MEQDEPGTAQGVWFAKGARETYPEDPHLSLVRDNINPSKAVFSVGTSIPNLQTDKYLFDPRTTGEINRDFKDVKNDVKVYCYDVGPSSVSIIIQLTSPTTLRIEKLGGGCGGGPWSFGSSYADFER